MPHASTVAKPVRHGKYRAVVFGTQFRYIRRLVDDARRPALRRV
jgi:hypothetical protein